MTRLAPSQPSEARTSVAGFDAGTAGVTPPANATRRGAFLTDVVVELGLADEATVQAVVEMARRSAKTVEQSLLDSGVLDEEQLSLAIAERHGLDHVDLDSFEVDLEAAAMIGRSAARRYRAVPIAFASDGALVVAVEDPFDSLGISDVEVMTRSEVRPVIATASCIQELIERLPEEPTMHAPAPPPEPEPRPEPQRQPEAERDAEPEPRPEPEPGLGPEPHEPEPNQGDGDDLHDDLRALREAVRKADALTVAVGRRIGELEGAEERAQRLEQELVAAHARIVELEQRIARVVSAAEEARAAAEKLGTLHRTLQDIDR